jgi:hypothetical protein
MNRATRLSLIAVMLLSASVLGILGWNAMYPVEPKQEPKQEVKQEPAQPRSNPEYEKLKADLEQHERRCLQIAKQATIVLPGPQNQSQVEQRVKECWNLVEIERKYVKDFPAKTIQ